MSHQSKINTKKVFWPHEDSGFCGLATQNKAKEWLKAEGPLVPGNLATQLMIGILRIISCGAKLRERSVNSLITTWLPLGPRSER
jgi:hypothetical protein